MDNINNPCDVYACPKRTCCNYPAATATGPLLEQLLFICSRSFVEWPVHLLCNALALCIAPDIDDPTRSQWQWQSPDQWLSRFPYILLALDNTIPGCGPHGRLPV